MLLTNQVQADPGVRPIYVVGTRRAVQAAAMFAAATSAKPVGGELVVAQTQT